jgi:hypothetical protein
MWNRDADDIDSIIGIFTLSSHCYLSKAGLPDGFGLRVGLRVGLPVGLAVGLTAV